MVLRKEGRAATSTQKTDTVSIAVVHSPFLPNTPESLQSRAFLLDRLGQAVPWAAARRR